MKYLTILYLLVSMLSTSCEVSPKPINYNEDQCEYCRMKISDNRFGAELVTLKGKVYKYDSAECLLRTLLEDDIENYAYKMVTDYSQPNKLISASDASFLISVNLPSPMGGNLTAYSEREVAVNFKEDKGGDIMNFDKLLVLYKENYK